jgi:drug/metabolite transporter (DMT)-like permease
VLTATVLALASAGLHAGWNFLVKTGEERGLVAWGQFAAAALLALPVLAVVGPPGVEAVPYLAASSLVHVVYLVALVRAYRIGDFSLAYPLARVSGALLAAFGGVLLLDDVLGDGSWVAIAIVLAGVLLLVGPETHLPTLAWAVLTGATIGTYTTIDAAGARRTDGLSYGLSLMVAAALAYSAYQLARGRGVPFRSSVRRSWRRYLVGGACAAAAYTLVLVAVRYAPVGYVATLRESSVVIAALLGWLVLHEPLGPRRTASTLVMAVGLALLIATR